MVEQIIVSGLTGFIGRHVADHLVHKGMGIVPIGRASDRERSAVPSPLLTPESAQQQFGGEWQLSSASTLIHLAGISGRMMCTENNVAEALSFARRAISYADACGAKKAILASSIYATLFENGLKTEYGKHKLQVEEIFRDQFRGRLIILRLPPVYGGDPDTSSVATLARMIARGMPLPLGCATAERDYLAMSNLVDLIACIVSAMGHSRKTHAAAIYEPSDRFAVSTRKLAQYLGHVVGRPARLIPVPSVLMRLFGSLVGRREFVAAAFGPLRTENSDRLIKDFGWKPAAKMPDSLDYLATGHTT
jgi:UDP-glucose 4-epimerase